MVFNRNFGLGFGGHSLAESSLRQQRTIDILDPKVQQQRIDKIRKEYFPSMTRHLTAERAFQLFNQHNEDGTVPSNWSREGMGAINNLLGEIQSAAEREYRATLNPEETQETVEVIAAITSPTIEAPQAKAVSVSAQESIPIPAVSVAPVVQKDLPHAAEPSPSAIDVAAAKSSPEVAVTRNFQPRAVPIPAARITPATGKNLPRPTESVPAVVDAPVIIASPEVVTLSSNARVGNGNGVVNIVSTADHVLPRNATTEDRLKVVDSGLAAIRSTMEMLLASLEAAEKAVQLLREDLAATQVAEEVPVAVQKSKKVMPASNGHGTPRVVQPVKMYDRPIMDLTGEEIAMLSAMPMDEALLFLMQTRHANVSAYFQRRNIKSPFVASSFSQDFGKAMGMLFALLDAMPKLQSHLSQSKNLSWKVLETWAHRYAGRPIENPVSAIAAEESSSDLPEEINDESTILSPAESNGEVQTEPEQQSADFSSDSASEQAEESDNPTVVADETIITSETEPSSSVEEQEQDSTESLESLVATLKSLIPPKIPGRRRQFNDGALRQKIVDAYELALTRQKGIWFAKEVGVGSSQIYTWQMENLSADPTSKLTEQAPANPIVIPDEEIASSEMGSSSSVEEQDSNGSPKTQVEHPALSQAAEQPDSAIISGEELLPKAEIKISEEGPIITEPLLNIPAQSLPPQKKLIPKPEEKPVSIFIGQPFNRLISTNKNPTDKMPMNEARRIMQHEASLREWEKGQDAAIGSTMSRQERMQIVQEFMACGSDKNAQQAVLARFNLVTLTSGKMIAWCLKYKDYDQSKVECAMRTMHGSDEEEDQESKESAIDPAAQMYSIEGLGEFLGTDDINLAVLSQESEAHPDDPLVCHKLALLEFMQPLTSSHAARYEELGDIEKRSDAERNEYAELWAMRHGLNHKHHDALTMGLLVQALEMGGSTVERFTALAEQYFGFPVAVKQERLKVKKSAK